MYTYKNHRLFLLVVLINYTHDFSKVLTIYWMELNNIYKFAVGICVVEWFY